MTTEPHSRHRPPPLDSLPELTRYQDDGCAVWHACLSCPLERCVYDDPGQARHAAVALRDEEIRRFHAAGWNMNDLVRRYQLSRRQIYRILGQRRDTV